jgi:uncharacterized protein YbcI
MRVLYCHVNLMSNASKGQIEAAISAALTQFEREMLGRGPKEARTHIVHDLVVVRLRGVLTPAEQQLAREEGGVTLIKQMRNRLVESFHMEIAQLVEKHAGAKVTTMHTDVSTHTGERLFVFVLEEDLEGKLRG